MLLPSLAWAQSPNPWPGQCPANTPGTALGCFPEAAAPGSTDLVFGWQVGQSPSTRAIQVQQLIAAFETAITGLPNTWTATQTFNAAVNGSGTFTVNVTPSTVLSTGSTVARSLAARTSDVINALDYGLHADGVTSDDAAFSAALTACEAKGTTMWLPPGNILFTGTTTMTLQNCTITGSGFFSGDAGSTGTTILLTSTSVKPFLARGNWSIIGVNFYWPNQTTGLISYPPLISDDGATGGGRFSLDRVNVVNAYDFMVGSAAVSWGEFTVSNSLLYAVHDLFAFGTIGDMPHITNIQASPGSWLGICNFTCESAVNAGDQHNRLFHALSGSVFQVQTANFGAEAWRDGVLLDSGATVAGAEFDMALDGVQTIIDASSGGEWASGNLFVGSNSACNTPQFGGSPIGNGPCFTMGSASVLDLNGYRIAGANGDVIDTDGSFINIANSTVDNFGSIADGSDYYFIKVIGSNPVLSVQNNRVQGLTGSAHVHGITVAAGTPQESQITGNAFIYLNDVINMPAPGGASVISGNWSASTHGTVSVTLTGSNGTNWWNNQFDKPPLATLGTCGGAGASIQGTIAGSITIGATPATTSCAFTLPFAPLGGSAGNCIVTPDFASAISASTAGLVWTISSGMFDMSGRHLFFNCSGAQ